MARGITENGVHQAADALVAAGERPTVERIRAHLGTGSPNTVTRWLETWWNGLGARLGHQRTSLALPDAPEEVVALASRWWELALSVAGDKAHADLAGDRQALLAERQALADQHAVQRDQLQLALAAADRAAQAGALADQRAIDLQRLCEQLRDQVTDLTVQRDRASERIARLESDALIHAQRADERDIEQGQERTRHSEHLRSVEDRAHAEIDRTRQEMRSLKKQLDASQLERQKLVDAQRVREEALRAAVADAQREAAVAQAQAKALTATRGSRVSKSPAIPSTRKTTPTKVKARDAKARPQRSRTPS
ncbi:hypothetical protein BJI69_18015 [Luteibacter rhizovicinus DSM 16549]|uniref:KfrA N-terminal DNA-binding domain-containing protein n=1 Tax=Luteibacter rhizovicinus DSM 16549 TaxID=1440763 RepID=A0A1L3EX58_9GAMM|nr:DNA-binding protein [Luteibacter rhizovicinus]APG05612.1 hypothetical protein BJI69_18015 [Luteibacter rhizovicinus DSM 16549]